MQAHQQRKIHLKVRVGDIEPDTHQGTSLRVKVHIGKESVNTIKNQLASSTELPSESLDCTPVILLQTNTSSGAEQVAAQLNGLIQGNTVSEDPKIKEAEQNLIENFGMYLQMSEASVKASGSKVVIYKSSPVFPPEMIGAFAGDLPNIATHQSIELNLLLKADAENMVQEALTGHGTEVLQVAKGAYFDIRVNYEGKLIGEIVKIALSQTGGSEQFEKLQGVIEAATALAPNASLDLEFPSATDLPDAYKTLLKAGHVKSAVKKLFEDLGAGQLSQGVNSLKHVNGPVEAYFFAGEVAAVHVQINVPGLFSSIANRAN